MRRRTGSSLTAALTAGLVLSGCVDEETKILPPEVQETRVVTPTFDASLEPAVAVLPLVPEDVATLTVTDFEQVREQMGLQDLTTADPRQDRDDFWARAEAERPLLSTGMLRPVEPRLRERFGLSQLDVAWEAHLFDDLGGEVGFVLAFRDGTDMRSVGRAVDAGLGALGGANLDAEHGLVTSGTTDGGDESWAADASLRPLVGPPATATYVALGCVDEPGAVDLDELEAYSVQFEGTLATARLGEERMDLFTRMRMGEGVPEFEAAFDGGVADPVSGRIGYVMSDPAAAASMALAAKLPFAACS